MKFLNKIAIACILLALSCSISIQAGELIPKDVQTFFNDGKYYIIKTYELPEEGNGEELAGKSFEQNGIIYNQNRIEKIPAEEVETKTAEAVEVINLSSQNRQLALSKAPGQKEYADGDGFIGILYPIAEQISFSVSGYTAKSYTAEDSRYYYNLSSRDTSSIPKTITSNGINMSVTDIKFIDSSNSDSGDTAVGGNFTALAYYKGVYVKQIPSGYAAAIPYQGEVSRNVVKYVDYKVVYEGQKMIMPETQEQTPKEKHVFLQGIVIAGGMCAISSLLILAYYLLQKFTQKKEEE